MNKKILDHQRLYKKAKDLLKIGDVENAAYFLKKAANKGSNPAELLLCRKMLEDAVEENSLEGIENAVGRIKSLGDNGYAKAYLELGNYYYRGNFLPKDLEKAFEFTEVAAERGHIEAQSKLGAFYAQGSGVEKDFDKAIYWSMRAAEQGNSESQNNLGGFYGEGLGVEKDMVKSTHWLGLAAEQGNMGAQYSLGLNYSPYVLGIDYENNNEKNHEKAIYWLKKAADQGHAKSQLALGQAYGSGLGVEVDKQTSLYWIGLAVEQGQPVAKLQLAQAYFDGEEIDGLTDEVHAFTLIKEAADTGEIAAFFPLAVCYTLGRGVAQSDLDAIYYLKTAAKLDDPNALYAMGEIYTKGCAGIEPDYDVARTWLMRAAEQGSLEGKALLDELQRQSFDNKQKVSDPKTLEFTILNQSFSLASPENRARVAREHGYEKPTKSSHVFDKSIEKLIATDESDEIEFKQTFSTPTKAENEGTPPSKHMVRYWALREIAGFLNSNDGTLLIGVIDGQNNPPTLVPIISGIEHDKKDSDSLDKYSSTITDLAINAFGAAAVKCINITFKEIDAKTVCRIDCKKSSSPVHYTVKQIDEKSNGTQLFIRLGTTTRKPKDIQEWEDWRRDHFKDEQAW